ncbi:hypothetical protein ACFL5Z_10640 [Planctomycetota bacterium]
MTDDRPTANLRLMICASHIAVKEDDRLQRQNSRRLLSVLCLLFSVFVFLSGCTEPKEDPPIWDKVKISDLAPHEGDKPRPSQKIKAINLDVHVFEVPAENVNELDKIRKKLYIRPLRLRDYGAFHANSFWIRFGHRRMWNEVYKMLLTADGQRATRISLMLPDAWPETVTITGLDRPRSIFYTAVNGSKEAANIGPGILGLRIKARSIPTSPGECSVTAYPVFTPPVKSTIPELNAQVKRREFPFTVAAFGLNMRPGHFVVLAPTEYVEDQTALGGLFFSNPQGNLFFREDQSNPPERKPAVRVFLLLCSRIDY